MVCASSGEKAKRTGRADVTAMPLGLDTPSTFGVVFLILGPAYQQATNAGIPVAAYGGIPGKSLVEIDCIAAAR